MNEIVDLEIPRSGRGGGAIAKSLSTGFPTRFREPSSGSRQGDGTCRRKPLVIEAPQRFKLGDHLNFTAYRD